MIRRRCRLGLVVMVGALAASLIGASGAWASYTVTPECTTNGHTSVCGSGWYTSNVSLSWTWTPNDGGNPTSGCLPHSYAQDTSTTASCTIEGPSGGGGAIQPINVELSNPSATVFASRAPDSNGWYNHPVAAIVTGTSFSGIASCSGTTYSGPDSTSATVSGTCTDNAGKTAAATSPGFSYDASAPLLRLSAAVADGVVVLNWVTGDIDPLSSLAISRAPGRRARAATVVDRRLGTAFRDTRVRNGVNYRYTLVATDLAGNTTTRVITVRPGPHLLAPVQDAMLTDPPALQWTRVRHASYYNVQVFRGSKKILSVWPTRPDLQLAKRWRFGGHRHRLSPGVYRWYVWPGFGPRTEARYGRQLGSATFVMT